MTHDFFVRGLMLYKYMEPCHSGFQCTGPSIFTPTYMKTAVALQDIYLGNLDSQEEESPVNQDNRRVAKMIVN